MESRMVIGVLIQICAQNGVVAMAQALSKRNCIFAGGKRFVHHASKASCSAPITAGPLIDPHYLTDAGLFVGGLLTWELWSQPFGTEASTLSLALRASGYELLFLNRRYFRIYPLRTNSQCSDPSVYSGRLTYQ
jgi:hypothetical protein